MAGSAGGFGTTPAGLAQSLVSMLREFERSVGFCEGAVMSFDPDGRPRAGTSGKGLLDRLTAAA